MRQITHFICTVEEKIAMKNEEVLRELSTEALHAANILRNLKDETRNKQELNLCTKLLKYLKDWERTENINQFKSKKTVFQIFSQARVNSGLSPLASRNKVVIFAKNALALDFPPGSDRQEKAVKFFQCLGEKFRMEYEKSPVREEETVS